jgi:hypothetical protein
MGGVEGRTRSASSRDSASQKPYMPPTLCRDTRRRMLQRLALPVPMSRRRRDGEDSGSAT